MARRTIDSLIALTIPEIQEAFLTAMQDVVDRAMLAEMVAAIEANDAEALYRATGFSPAALSPILDRIEQAYLDAADVTVEGWPNVIRTPTGRVVFRFNGRNAVVEEDLKVRSSALITALSEEIRENIRTTLERGMIAGDNPRTTALNIVGRVDLSTKKRVGGVIGLTRNQERWVSSSKTYLEQGSEKYFSLSLRDKRFDGTVRKAFESGKPLSKDTISKLVTSYKSRALRYRAEAIARTETIQSINRGQYMSMKQGIEEGVLQNGAVTKYWDAVGDRKTRPTHSSLEEATKKNPLQLDEPFVSPSGDRMMFPGDSSLGADAKEIVHCRCRIRYNVDFNYGVD